MEPIYFEGKRLRVAKDLPRKTLDTISMKLIRSLPDGSLEMPTHEKVVEYLDGLAEEHKIGHFVLNGEYGKLILYDNLDVLNSLNILEIKAKHCTQVIKVQCYDDPVSREAKIPKELQGIKELYKVPEVLFSAGSCVYFLCRENKVVYVGKSINIQTRLQQHIKDKQFEQVFYIRVSPLELDTVESALIAMLKPELNRTNQSLNESRQVIATTMLGLEQMVN